MELSEIFYVMAIVYMSIMFLLMIAALIAILAIKHKISIIQHNLEEKFHTLLEVVRAGEFLVHKAKDTFTKDK